MSAFLRLLAAFLVGGLAGAAAMLYLQPTFSIVVTNAPAAVTTLVDAHPPVVEEPEFVPPPAPVATSGAVAKGTTPSSPAPASVSPAPSPATAAPAPLDYAQVAARPTFWPAEVLAAVPSVITFTEDGKKTGEMKLATGAVLQLSGVQADGTLELRAQGRKFTLHAKFTDFDDHVRKKAQQLLAGPPAGRPRRRRPPPFPRPSSRFRRRWRRRSPAALSRSSRSSTPFTAVAPRSPPRIPPRRPSLLRPRPLRRS